MAGLSKAPSYRELEVGEIRNSEHRRWLDRNGYGPSGAKVVIQTTVEGSNVSATATEIELAIGGGMVLATGFVGVPVAAHMRATKVAVSWMADNEPGDWTLRLHKRTGTGTFTEVAQFTTTTTS